MPVHLACRRRRTYSTALGLYQEQCGLRNVYMSWGAAEYLYMLLVLNQTQLPEEALFMIRLVPRRRLHPWAFVALHCCGYCCWPESGASVFGQSSVRKGAWLRAV